jgi:hypothetical protein
MTHRDTFAYYGKYRLVKHHIHCTWAAQHVGSLPVYSATGGANIQGRINWWAVTQLLLGPYHQFSSFQTHRVSALMRNRPMGSTNLLTKRTLTDGVIRTSFQRGITRSRADTVAAKGPIKPPVPQCTVLLSHVLKTIRAIMYTHILIFIFHFNPRIFHTPLTFTLPAEVLYKYAPRHKGYWMQHWL